MDWRSSLLSKAFWIGILASALVGLSPPPAAVAEESAGQVVCVKDQVCRDTTTRLPLRVLPRPRSALYKGPSAEPNNIVKDNVPAFSPLYAFSRPDGAGTATGDDAKGWYQVGGTVTRPSGWMQARDLFEWRQALVVGYAPVGVAPNQRNPVIFFKTLDQASAIAEADDRAAKTATLLGAIKAQSPPSTVVSHEPFGGGWLNIDDKFYLLPILDYKVVRLDDDPIRYLMLAAADLRERALPGQAGQDMREVAPTASSDKIINELADLDVDLVFLMDMTSSMGPFIEQTRRSMTDIANAIAQDNQRNQHTRFGLVGYRDNSELMPGLEWTTKNFTPSLVEGREILRVINTASEASSSSDDYPEEVFAGVKAAQASKWRPNALRIIVQVGDASAHPPGHKYNTTGGLDETAIRKTLDLDKITFMSLHLRDPRAEPDWAVAEAQFSRLATNPGADKPAYFAVPSRDEGAYPAISKQVAGKIVALTDPAQRAAVASSLAGNDKAATPSSAQGAGSTSPADQASILNNTLMASLMTVVGRAEKAPRDVTGWSSDHDMANSKIRTLEVRVLLSQRQVNDLSGQLDRLLQSIKESKLTSSSLFSSLQALSAGMESKGDTSKSEVDDLSSSRLLPSWIASLPYKSNVLNLNDASWAAMSPDDRGRFESTLLADLDYYRDVLKTPGRWKKLDEGDAAVESVAAIPLDMLP